jgi:uncharacterized protein YecE (DUF72 family)
MNAVRFFVGTSGWTYDDWWGTFYPEDLKASERLSYYATQFNTVEINATFYRAPTAPMIEAWNRRLGSEFHLVVKGSRVVTHLKKLDDCGEQLEFFLDRIRGLKRLKVILWQLPPSIHKDVARLERFLSWLPEWARHAVEFRHKSWWDEEVREVLARHSAAFVAVSHPKVPETILPTTDFLYVRFHGQGRDLYQYDYSKDELSHWVSIMKPHLSGRMAYVFFNNDYNANAPRNALTMREMLSELLTVAPT